MGSIEGELCRCSYVRTTEDAVSEFNRRRYSIKINETLEMELLRFFFFNFILQFVKFTRSYNITPSVLISANHSTTESGNSAPVHNGISTWIEVSLAH